MSLRARACGSRSGRSGRSRPPSGCAPRSPSTGPRAHKAAQHTSPTRSPASHSRTLTQAHINALSHAHINAAFERNSLCLCPFG
eukprot:3098920-Rhodomonas_salina.1